MKKLLTILLIFFAAKAFGQVYQPPLLFGKYENRMIVLYHFAFPGDTITPPVGFRDKPGLGFKDGVTYIWNPVTQRYESISASTQAKTEAPLYTYQDTLRIGVVPTEKGGTGQTVVGSPYQLFRTNAGATGTEWWTPNFLTRDSIFNTTTGPIDWKFPMVTTTSGGRLQVGVDYGAPIYNSDFVQNYHWQAGTPPHGSLWVFDSTAGGEWKHGFATPDGTVIPGIDSVWIANDSLYTIKGSDTTAQFIGFSATDISNWNTAYSWGNHATVGYLTNITGYLAEGANVTIDGTGTAGDPYVINAAGGGVTTTDVFADNLLVQPGYVTWSGTGLTFDVTAATYDIAHVRYNSSAGQITLDAADPTDPRIDVIAVDNTGSIVKITGTAEANPVQPQIDPSTQVLLTSILIPAGATTPYGVSDEVIYDENIEWTSAAVGLTANFDNATNNYNGSKSAAISGFSNGQAVQWTNGSLVAPANQVLSLQVRLSSNWNNSNNASIMLMRGAVPISQALLATNYGLVKSNSGGYQTVSIPITAFSPTDSFDRVRVTFIGNSGNTVNIDYVRLQSGITTVGPVQDIHVIGTTFTGTTLSIATSDGKTYTTTINAGAATDTYVTGVNYSGDVLTVTLNSGATYTTTIAASGGTSTHTVTLAMPSAFNVTSPITNGGTLTVTGAGTDTQTITGTGSLVNNKGVSNFQTSGSTYTLTLVDGSTYTGTLSGGSSAKDTLQHTITIPTPTDAEDWTVFYSKKAITIHEVAEVVRGSSSPSATYYIAFGSNRGVESNYLFSASRTASSTVGATTTTFADATVPAGSFIFIKTTSISGTISELSVTLTFTNDD